MKGRMIFATISVLIFVYALYVYVRKGDSTIVIQEQIDRPKIELTQYEYLRVKDDVITARLIGQNSRLMEGGIVQLRDSFRAVRFKNERREELTAESADIELPSAHLAEGSQEVHVKRAVIFGQVDLHSEDKRFETEEAVYLEEDQTIRSQVPAKVQQINQYISADKGFDYYISNETLKMMGEVEGIIVPAQLKKTPRPGRSP